MSTHHPPPCIDAADGVGTQGASAARPGAAPSRRRRWRNALSGAVAIAAAASLTGLAPGSAAAGEPPSAADPARLVGTASPSAIPGRYIVALKGAPETDRASASADAVTRARARGVRQTRRYKHAFNGFAATLTPAQLDALRDDPDVAYIAADATVQADGSQSPATWGLDRIDQRDLPLNNMLRVPRDRSRRARRTSSTPAFGPPTPSSADARSSGFDVIDGGAADDCHGHGTHVAGTIGGSTYGVAKKVRLVAVRVLDCAGFGTVAGVIAGVDWVTNDHQAGDPAVANMSLGGGAVAGAGRRRRQLDR